MPLFCRYCSFRCSDNRALLQHVKDVHSFDPGFRIECGVCGQTFKVFSSYTSHVSRKHPDITNSESGSSALETCDLDNQATQSSSSTTDDPLEVNYNLIEEQDSTGSSGNASLDSLGEGRLQPITQIQQLSMSAASFLVTLKEKYKVSQSAIDYVVQGTSALVKQSVGIFKTTKEEVDPFAGFSTAYLQKKFIEQHFPYVEPVEITLGVRWATKNSGPQAGQLIQKQDKFAYIPFLKMLEVLLQNKSISNQVLMPHLSEDGFLRDICDGEQAKAHSNCDDCYFLQVIAYFDEVEVCNPLGSRVKIHKLGVLYFTLGNIFPKYRSSLSAIFLWGVVKSTHIAEYGFQKILQPFIADLNELARNGINVTISNKQFLFKGSLQLFLADTLAAHQLGGFKVGVGFALRKCRNCMATNDDIQIKFRSEDFESRTPELHDYHCSLLCVPLREHNSTTCGVNFRSPLNDIVNFHVANWQLPQDVMHVILEGVLQKEIFLLLKNLIVEKKVFNLSTLNARMQSFQFGYLEVASKPATIDIKVLTSDSSSLRQSASQSWLLGRFLPLLVGDLIPEGDNHWDTFLLFHEILAYCMAPCVSLASLSYLSVLIGMHHQAFTTCYPDTSVTPKMHYMLHLPEQMKRFGPLVRYWCMRMEAKNLYAKRAASCGNFKNICMSMATRHQRLFSSLLVNENMLDENIECGPGPEAKPIQAEEVYIARLIKAKFSSIDNECIIFRPRWIKLNGTLYRPGCYVVLGFDGILPLFGKIELILIVAGEPLLLLKPHVTTGYSQHLRSYIIDCVHNSHLIAFFLSELADYYPLHAHHSFA